MGEEGTVIVISGDFGVRDSLSELFVTTGLTVETYPSLETWHDTGEAQGARCMVLDARGGEFASPEWLARFAAACSSLPVLVLAHRGDVPTAAKAIKQGASDVLQKPLADENLLGQIRQLLANSGNGHSIGEPL